MTLLELAEFVTDKIGQTDADSLAQCKSYLKKRHEMAWNSHLWRDSVCVGLYDVAAGQNQLLLGDTRDGGYTMEKAVSVCHGTDVMALAVEDYLQMFFTDPTSFNTNGSMLRFAHMSQAVRISGTGAAATINHTWTPAGTGDETYTVIYDQVNGSQSISTYTRDADSTNGASAAAIVRLQISAKASTTPEGTTPTLALTFSSSLISHTFDANTYDAPRFGRIRFFAPPQTATTVRIIGKSRMPSFENDEDLPAIGNMDNALIALAMGDMLERARQYGKAGLKFSEAQGHLRSLIDQELNQSASNMRVIPAVEPMAGWATLSPTKGDF